MNIAKILARLAEDLKVLLAYNILEVKALMPTKMSELENDNNYIMETELSLGMHSDGLVYIFKNGKPIGKGLKLAEYTPEETDNLLDLYEVYLNQRYSSSGGGIISDTVTDGIFALYIPLESGNGVTHTLEFSNLKMSLSESSRSTMYLLDSNKSNPTTVNGSSIFDEMTTGLTESTDGTSATVTFSGTESAKYIVISIQVQTTTITSNDIADYIIRLK